MTEKGTNKLLAEAKKVLESNWMEGYTKPSSLLYPHQWSWDSCFIAIGYSNYDPLKAENELKHLFKGQWYNGMVPHIVYNQKKDGGYFPYPGFWGLEKTDDAPSKIKTSGITQPPLHATAALRIIQRQSDSEKALSFSKMIYPKLLKYHSYLYEHRDPYKEGLVYLRHPWESGLDNSPAWDGPMKAIDLGDEPVPIRQDLDKGVPREERPTDWDYNRYLYLVELFKTHNYDEQEIFKETPFKVQDPLFNSILLKADEDLLRIGEFLREDVELIRDWINKTREGLNSKLWNEGEGHYYAYDLKSGKSLDVKTASGFAPLFGGAPSTESSKRLYEALDSASFCPQHQKACFSIPNYNLLGEGFNPRNYWRGPVWINMNWIIMEGLKRYGFREKAGSVQDDIVELINRFGFHEYFDPFSGKGYGSSGFSWSAALLIETISNPI